MVISFSLLAITMLSVLVESSSQGETCIKPSIESITHYSYFLYCYKCTVFFSFTVTVLHACKMLGMNQTFTYCSTVVMLAKLPMVFMS